MWFMRSMDPIHFLFLVVALTALAAGTQWLARRGESAGIRRLARQWQRHYSRGDQFSFADRLTERLPVPGAADVRVVDLIYGRGEGSYDYIFRAEFITGVVRAKRRVRRVVAFREHKTPTGAGEWSALVIAPAEMSLAEQYRHLYEMQGGAQRGSSSRGEMVSTRVEEPLRRSSQR